MPVLARMQDVFPPPQYIMLPSVGVDISDTSLKYIQFRLSAQHAVQKKPIRFFGDIDIAAGALNRGNIAEPKALVEALRAMREATGASYVRVSLPEERAYLFETEVKRDTPLREIRGLLEFRLEENVPLSPRDAIFDYDIVEDDIKAGVYRVSVTAYARDTIVGYFEACQAAKVTPLSFEVEAQAIARAALPVTTLGTHMIIDFGKTRTGVGIVHRGQLMYTSTIDIGGRELSSVLRRQLGEKEEKELTLIKNTMGLVRSRDDSTVYDALMMTVSAIKDEIALRIQYWHSRAVDREERHIESLILCGGSANLNGFPSYLTETLGINTNRADVWRNVLSLAHQIPPIDRFHSYGYATAIGLALRTDI